MLLLLIAGGLIVYVAAESAETDFWIGLLATLVVGIFSLRRLDELMDVRGWARRRFEKSTKI
jgi:hypothetical protein